MNFVCLFLTLSFLAFSKPGVYPVESLDISDGVEDLRPLSHPIKRFQIVGIGESAHGSRGFLQAKLKVVKYLVEKKKVRLILLESEYLKTEVFNDYLYSCYQRKRPNKDLDEILKNLNIIYQNESTKKLLQYLCTFSYEKQEEISFHGIDIWENPWANRNVLEKLADKIKNNSFNKVFGIAKNNCFAWDVDSWQAAKTKKYWKYLLETWRLPAESHRRCLGALFNLGSVIERLDSITKDEKFLGLMALKVSNIYQQVRDLYVIDFPKALELRDSLQAGLVIDWYEKYKKTKKAVLLAHNVHISKKQSAILAKYPGSRFRWSGVQSAGESLVGHFGSQYKAIAISGYEVASSRDGAYDLLNSLDALDFHLKDFGPYLLVNPKAPWIKKKKWWLHNENDPMYMNPVEQYDMIFYIRKSIEAKPF